MGGRCRIVPPPCCAVTVVQERLQHNNRLINIQMRGRVEDERVMVSSNGVGAAACGCCFCDGAMVVGMYCTFLHPTLVEIKCDLLVSLLLGLVSFGCVCSDNVHVVGDRQRMKVTRNKDGIE